MFLYKTWLRACEKWFPKCSHTRTTHQTHTHTHTHTLSQFHNYSSHTHHQHSTSNASEPFDLACGRWGASLDEYALLDTAAGLVNDALSCGEWVSVRMCKYVCVCIRVCVCVLVMFNRTIKKAKQLLWKRLQNAHQASFHDRVTQTKCCHQLIVVVWCCFRLFVEVDCSALFQ